MCLGGDFPIYHAAYLLAPSSATPAPLETRSQINPFGIRAQFTASAR